MRHVRRRNSAPGDLDEDALREALASYPVSLAVLFGSWAGGTAGELSDVDVAVLFEDSVGDERAYDLLDEMTAAITDATGFEAVDLVDLSSVSPGFGREILSRGRRLLGDEATAVRLESRFRLLDLDFEPVRAEWQRALADRIAEGRYGRR